MTDITDVADQLGFDLDEPLQAECRDAANELANAVAAIEANAPSVSFDERSLESQHNALLWGYETPRSLDVTGPMDGFRVAVKDNIAAKGLTLTCGTKSYSHVPAFDAKVVDRLLDAGASLVGKANMDAFGFGASGERSEVAAVTNPLDSDRVPGGSSSGSSVSVATGAVDAALGTDTGGSARIPAACCGIVGHKPSFGRISRHGVVPFASSLDTVGALGRDVETARRVFESIRGPDRHDATTVAVDADSDGPPLTVGIPQSFLDPCSEPVIESVEQLLAEIEANLDTEVVRIEDDDLLLGAIAEAYRLVGVTEFSWFVRQRGVAHGLGTTYDEAWNRSLAVYFESGGLSDYVAQRVLPSAYLDAKLDGQPYVKARREAARFTDRLRNVFGNVEALLVPTIRTLPPERGTVNTVERLFDLIGNTSPFNLSGHPATSVPFDSVEGLPVSIQVVTPKLADKRALAGAEHIERMVHKSEALNPPSLPV